MNFGSMLTAMVTPFDESGNVDYVVLTELIEHLIDTGTEGLVVTGTTGESPVLTAEEAGAIYKHVVKIVDKRVPVIAGTGTNNTAQTIAQSKVAEDAGVDGLMVVVPYYNRPNQAGLYNHFKTVATTTTLPIMLYNIPGRSGVHMDAETIIELSKLDNIVSVKEASGNLEQVTTIVSRTPDNFTVYSGDDSKTIPMMAIGAVGVVSVASHVIGKEIQEMIRTFTNGEVEKAASLHQDLLPQMDALFIAPNPAPVKAALRLKGIEVGAVKAPLVDLSAEELAVLKQYY